MKESILYEKLKNGIVKCKTCSHHCVIALSHRGICGVRENIGGKLFFLPYARAIAANIDPVEKKPLFHFMPGTKTFSISTVGCNFRCGNCQNWAISQFGKLAPHQNTATQGVKRRVAEKNAIGNFGAGTPVITREMFEKSGEDLPPKKVIELAKENGCPSISYTYTEPTIFLEYALDTMKLAKKAELKNVWVSNGFMSRETLKLIVPYLDAINIDIKSFDDKFYRENCGAHLTPILENCKEIVKNKVWLETTTLIIPTLSGDEKMLCKIAKFIQSELGDFVPWHVSAFSGAISWKLQSLPDTPVEKVRRAYEIGKSAGLKYVYAGNVYDQEMENTFCPKCKKVAVSRLGYVVKKFYKNGKCSKCKSKMDLID